MSHDPRLTWVLVGALGAALAIALFALHSGVDREAEPAPVLSPAIYRPLVEDPPGPPRGVSALLPFSGPVVLGR